MVLNEKYFNGERFYKLTFIDELPKVHRSGGRTDRIAKFICECGTHTIKRLYSVVTGETKSCGCLSAQTSKKLFTTHGKTKTKEYSIYAGIKKRCFNIKSPQYKNYGGRGIKMCDRWNESFSNFILDMGKISIGCSSIERIDNNGDYEPSNCRWATAKEQGRNKRNNRIITANGVSMPLAAWAEKLNIPVGTIEQRISKYGFSDEDAILKPRQKRKYIATYVDFCNTTKGKRKGRQVPRMGAGTGRGS